MRTRLTRVGWLCLLVGGCAAALAGEAAPGTDRDRPIAALPAEVPIAASPGWFAWSVERKDGWHLVTRRGAARPRIQPVPPRRWAFDLDLGTDASGATVVTYSRCRARRIDGFASAVGCRVHVLDPLTGVERPVDTKTPAGASDAWPSMWKGEVAFARDLAGDRPDVGHVMLAVAGQDELVDLGTGSVARYCSGEGCPTTVDPETVGRAGSIDLGENVVAYRWRWSGAQEILSVQRDTGLSLVLAGGYNGEVCTEGIDTTAVGKPVVHRGRVVFAVTETECYEDTSYVGRQVPPSTGVTEGRTARRLIDVVSDGSRLYGLRDDGPGGEDDPGCTTARPCELRPLAQPRYRRGWEAEPPLLAPAPVP